MSSYIIGEIGQNHNGSVDLAKLLIEIAARPVVDKLFGQKLRGMDAIKLTKRDLSEELSNSQMSKPYNSANSFGKTYGEHRAKLELDNNQHYELYQYAKSFGLDFVETICSKKAAGMLDLFQPDRLKVASRDLANLPLLEVLADTKIPIILSLGMADKKELDEALEVITRCHENVSILHCVSEYPTQYKNVNLRTISYLKREYSKYTIGFSDHTIGIATPLAAVALGAEILEKHITIDRKMKGTDQPGSLAIDGIGRMVRDIRNLELAMGVDDILLCSDVINAKVKLERSIASLCDLAAGHVLTENDIHLLSPGDGLKWNQRDLVLGKCLKNDIKANEIIYKESLE